MSILTDINAALVVAYAGIGLALPTEYDARDFNPPASGVWASIKNFPADKSVSSLGSSGQDVVSGFFQISFYVPENDGTGRILGYADAALEQFKNGKRFSYNGKEVKVTRSEMTQIRKPSGSASYSITLSFYWESLAAR